MAKKAKKASIVMIHGVAVSLEYKPLNGNHLQDEKLFGYFRDESITIDEDIEELTLKKTQLHVCVHAALDISGVAETLTPQQEEAVCRSIETLGEYFNL